MRGLTSPGRLLFLNGGFADGRTAFVKDGIVQFTMRELQAVLRSPLLWSALAAAGLVLGIAGPFGTFETLPLPARLAYWSAITVATYLTGFLSVTVLNGLFPGRRRTALRDGAFGVLAGLPVAAIVWLANQWIFPAGGIGFMTLLAYVTVVTALASAVVAGFALRLEAPDEAGPAPPEAAPARQTSVPERPPLLDRLPVELRGRLRRLSMQDHYVEVVTDRGAHLVLMRMSDAIAETGGIDGLQIHRSHWVAREAVRDSVRRGDRLMLRLADGTELPVSRSRVRAVRDAGIA
jgi:hypothetical protein